jgi:hypothetical protein
MGAYRHDAVFAVKGTWAHLPRSGNHKFQEVLAFTGLNIPQAVAVDEQLGGQTAGRLRCRGTKAVEPALNLDPRMNARCIASAGFDLDFG